MQFVANDGRSLTSSFLRASRLAFCVRTPVDELLSLSPVEHELYCALQLPRYIGFALVAAQCFRFAARHVATVDAFPRPTRVRWVRDTYVTSVKGALKCAVSYAVKNVISTATLRYSAYALDYTRALPSYDVPALAIRGLHYLGLRCVGLYGGGGDLGARLATTCLAANAHAATSASALSRPLILDFLLDGYMFRYMCFWIGNPFGFSRFMRLTESNSSGACTSHITPAAFEGYRMGAHDVCMVMVAVTLQQTIGAAITYGCGPYVRAWVHNAAARVVSAGSRVFGRIGEGASKADQPRLVPGPRWEFNHEVWLVRLAIRLVTQLMLVGPIMTRLVGWDNCVVRMRLPFASSASAWGGCVAIPAAVVIYVVNDTLAFGIVTPWLESLYGVYRRAYNDAGSELSIEAKLSAGDVSPEAAAALRDALGPRVAAEVLDQRASGGEFRVNVAKVAAQSLIRFNTVKACKLYFNAMVGVGYDSLTDANISSVYNFASAHVIDHNPAIAPLRYSLLYLCCCMRQLEALDPRRDSRRAALIYEVIGIGSVKRLNVGDPSDPIRPLGAEDEDGDDDGSILETHGDEVSESGAEYCAPDVNAPQQQQGQHIVDKCAVCLNTVDSLSTVDAAVTQCRHVFHTACLAEALVANGTCPMCKGDLMRRVGGVDDEGHDVQDTRFIPPMAVNLSTGQAYSYTLVKANYKYNQAAKSFFVRGMQLARNHRHWEGDTYMCANFLEGRAMRDSNISAALMRKVLRELGSLSTARTRAYVSLGWDVDCPQLPSYGRTIVLTWMMSQQRHSYFYVEPVSLSTLGW